MPRSLKQMAEPRPSKASTAKASTTLSTEVTAGPALELIRAKYRKSKKFRTSLRRDPVTILKAHGIEVSPQFAINVAETSFKKGIVQLLVFDSSVPRDWDFDSDDVIVPMTSTMVNCMGSTKEC
jgi:hypothetical protein